MFFCSARASAILPGIACLLLVGSAYANANRSIQVGDGTETDGHSTVNGSITIGRSAIVNGSLETVNGAIIVDDDASIDNAETVNGAVRLGAGVMADNVSSVNGSIQIGGSATIGGEVSVVNGKITIGTGTRVAGGVSNVNGDLLIEGTEIGGDLSTVNGDVMLTDNSVLQGDLTIERPGGWGWNREKRRKPRVVIGPGTLIAGEIRLEREVELYISDTASVGGVSGEMSLDDAVRFSGARP